MDVGGHACPGHDDRRMRFERSRGGADGGPSRGLSRAPPAEPTRGHSRELPAHLGSREDVSSGPAPLDGAGAGAVGRGAVAAPAGRPQPQQRQARAGDVEVAGRLGERKGERGQEVGAGGRGADRDPRRAPAGTGAAGRQGPPPVPDGLAEVGRTHRTACLLPSGRGGGASSCKNFSKESHLQILKI